ncbi:MAG: DEAD/DEAH box helicase [Nitrospirae bacterium]|nr:MAG: DEAD/DEAH box helicase [Nitrospirota bacterium]
MVLSDICLPMEQENKITSIIEFLKSDRTIGPGVTEHRFISATAPSFADIRITPVLRDALGKRGITKFYTHQAEGIERIRQGDNVVVMTPTASGKSLIYNVPVVEAMLQCPDAKALYIFPLKGLEQDQVKKINELLADCMPQQIKNKSGLDFAEVYDGDTTPYRRKKIRDNPPNIIFTNPDMLHLALNQFHRKWEDFFRNLRFIVVDEIHAYRGVFGSHVGHVLRRLGRICTHWGSNPQIISCSATIANPKELSESLTGQSFSLVCNTGASQSGRNFVFISPIDSAYSEATRVFVKCVNAGLRTILFTKARKITELIYRWSIERAPLLKDKISPYRAGFLPQERREIERRLFSGELTGVISTSALELGVDIGGLDVCILCGYPGSVSSTWQRAGRVGREGRESLVVMIALKDALDHYIVSHPGTFFEKPHEAAICHPDNLSIMKKHLVCAAAEVALKDQEKLYGTGVFLSAVQELEREGALRRSKAGSSWFTPKRLFHAEVGIRSIGRPLKLRDRNGKYIGDLDGKRIYRDGFPGAIYLHRGRQYEVSFSDPAEKTARCSEVDVDYYTQALSNEHIEIIGEPQASERQLSRDIGLYHGRLRITYRVVGYDRKNLYNGSKLSRHSVEMPEYIFETEGIAMLIGKRLENILRDNGCDFSGALHAAEHLLISALPLFSLCDKGDIGGLSYPVYPDFNTPAIFIYDGCEGGIGLAKRVLDLPEEWINSAVEIAKNCDCEEGCPSCVQDSQCGSANTPLDKKGALLFFNALIG